MNVRAKTLGNLYLRKKITKAGLKQAIADGVITEAQYQEIIAEQQ